MSLSNEYDGIFFSLRNFTANSGERFHKGLFFLCIFGHQNYDSTEKFSRVELLRTCTSDFTKKICDGPNQNLTTYLLKKNKHPLSKNYTVMF